VISGRVHRDGRAISRLSSWAKEDIDLTVQNVQFVQAVQAVSEGIKDVGLFGRLVSIYLDSFMPLRFK
jgi:hypothetical protein